MSKEKISIGFDLAKPGSEQTMITEFSGCKKYRYRLVRGFDSLSEKQRYLGFVMLNPSTADEVIDDPTISRCINFAKNNGYSGIVVMNLNAFRSTNPKKLISVEDPVGEHNDRLLMDFASGIVDIVCAWGNNADKSRAAAVIKILKSTEAKLWCLGLNQTGHPKHPLYISGAQHLIPFEGNEL